MTEAPDPPAPSRLGTLLAASAVALVIGLWGVTVGGRVIRAPPAPLALAITLLPWLYVGVMVYAFACWSALPDRRAFPIAIGVLLVSAGLLWGPLWALGGERAEGAEVRAMTWNVRRLWGAEGDGGDPTRCVLQAIEDAEPDVLTLLEVSRADVDVLSERLGLTCAHSAYLGTGETTGGLAACTRGDRVRLRAGEGQRFVDQSDWRYVFAEAEVEGRVFNVLAVHLHPYWPLELSDVGAAVVRGRTEEVARAGEAVVEAQGAQSVALLQRVGRFEDPTIVAGDFNSTGDASLHVALRRTLVDAWQQGGRGWGATVAMSGWLPLRIDYVYVTDTFAVRSAEVAPARCSDHRAVVADLVLRDGP